ncbi:hypothetical protein JKG47_05345 [Acidithiobacillus sp. MC6.1]|nr:hypothetical protein [Acidithiobacillus sp. MC6.1]
MKRRNESPAIPAGYLDALAKLYGKQPIAEAETAPQRTQTTEVLPVPHSAKGKQS